MEPLLTAAEMRKADHFAISELGIPETVLMEHAALAVARAVEERFGCLLPKTRGILLAGTGNNGGDALASARILAHQGCTNLLVVLSGGEKQLSPSAALQLKILGKLGIAYSHELTDELLAACDWVVDGLLGTGLSRPVEGAVAAIIQRVNRFHRERWIVAIDVPSGLDSDRGIPLGEAIRASETITLGYLKRGLVSGVAADYVGRLRLETLQIPRSVPGLVSETFLYGTQDAARLLPERPPSSHKGRFGHVHILAGPPDKQGAAALSALAALRGGAGLATVHADERDLESLRPRLSAAVMTSVWAKDFFEKDPGGSEVAVLGPGLGVNSLTRSQVEAALKSNWPLVLDADALNTIAAQGETLSPLIRLRSQRCMTVLTPHPKEAARLLGVSTEQVQRDRFAAARRLVERFGAYAILKGKGSLIVGPNSPTLVVTQGNTALSTAGTGDVLSGLIGAVLATGVPALRALPFAVYLHGRAAELYTASIGSEYGALATDIAESLPTAFRELEGKRAGG